MAGLYGMALANDQGMNADDPLEYSSSADPYWPPAHADASQIQGPMETGAVPDSTESSPDLYGPLDTSVSSQPESGE